MKKKVFDPLLLENQLCFPIYASARKIVAAYNPYLKKIGLTYAQYITMMVLWEEKAITMHELGKRLWHKSSKSSYMQLSVPWNKQDVNC